uniref:Pre-mRNA splicing factor, putative n=1 Tax=Arundo donax TaxID=35708 RepID=A0A0A9FFF0_ARUDO
MGPGSHLMPSSRRLLTTIHELKCYGLWLQRRNGWLEMCLLLGPFFRKLTLLSPIQKRYG